jgi:N-acetylglucosaminyldiphosphoundecaprenol N-acetyl-beta-D-mannosaminyltransferase
MSDQELQVLAGEINRSDADIVWVGLSTPKQEVFATRLAQFTRVHVLATIGAFDFHVGNVKEAPGIFRRFGLEWFLPLMRRAAALVSAVHRGGAAVYPL